MSTTQARRDHVYRHLRDEAHVVCRPLDAAFDNMRSRNLRAPAELYRMIHGSPN